MSVSGLLKRNNNKYRAKTRKNNSDNRFFLYIIFYHIFSGLAGLFKND
jgi:hypothetical protein